MATVEAAVVIPFLIMLILATVDVGQYVIVAQSVSNASREAARLAARYTTVNVSEVETAASDYVNNISPNTSVQVNISDETGNAVPAGDLTNIPTGSEITVEVVLPFDNLRWLEIVSLLSNNPLKTATTVRRE